MALALSSCRRLPYFFFFFTAGKFSPRFIRASIAIHEDIASINPENCYPPYIFGENISPIRTKTIPFGGKVKRASRRECLKFGNISADKGGRSALLALTETARGAKRASGK